MNMTTRYMGLLFFWFNIKDLGGYSESEFSSILEEVKNEYSSLPQAYRDYTLKWIQSLDKLAKTGISLRFVDMGIMFINEAFKQNKFLDIKVELEKVLSELNKLLNKSDKEIAKILIDNSPVGVASTPQHDSSSEDILSSDDLIGIAESLHEACAMGFPSEVRRFLAANPDVNSSNWVSDFTPLLVCVSGTDDRNRQEIIELLHAAGADLEIKDSEKGLTPLMFTALRNKSLCAETLLKCGANINALEDNDATALHAAAYHGNIEVTRVLLEFGADPIKEDRFGNSPISLASSQGHTALLTILLERTGHKS